MDETKRCAAVSIEADSTGNAEENLEGWIPCLATPAELRDALNKAFDYRGDVTITLKSGEKIEGYIFDRRGDGPSLEQCQVRIYPKHKNEKISIRYSDIEGLEFTGRDAAAGRHFHHWLKTYRERKALGEQDVSLHPDPLD
jgi:hypothetical protein